MAFKKGNSIFIVYASKMRAVDIFISYLKFCLSVNLCPLQQKAYFHRHIYLPYTLGNQVKTG